MTNVVAIIQSRMGSQRLPGKALADICGAPTLQRVIERVKQAELVTEVMVATTVRDEDDVVAELAWKCEAEVFRGSSATPSTTPPTWSSAATQEGWTWR